MCNMQAVCPQIALDYHKLRQSLTLCNKINAAAQIYFVDTKVSYHLGELLLLAFLKAYRPVKIIHSERLNPFRTE